MKLFKKGKLLLLIPVILVPLLFISAGQTDFRMAKNLEVLFNLFREVNLYYVDETDPDFLMKGSAEGMLMSLDPYTEFLSEEDMEGFEITTTGKYGGIGSLIRQNGDYVEIRQPYRGFAADKAGLKIGDKILAIEGEDMKGADPTTVSNKMKGDPGSILHIRVERFADGTVEDLVIRRERIAISGVPYYGMLNDTVGYIAHDDFMSDCAAEIRDAIMDLKGQGMTSLVYDLRNNGGGVLQEAVKIVGMFVPTGTEVVTIRGKAKETDATYRTMGTPIDTDMPIAVLLNRNSASAAEIVAGALQDMDRAVLIGQRSFGKGLVQTTRPVGYNSYVKLTTAKYYIPSGRCIQAIDYSHRNEDGGVEYVPDSLVQEFTTVNGRKVYDGGGIMPDISVEVPYISIFTVHLYGYGYIDDFAKAYVKKHGFQPVDPDTFTLSEADYRDFIAFMADKPVEYESDTKSALESFRKIAAREKYEERIDEQLRAIAEKISKNKEEELELLRPEIARLIEDEIVLYYHYAQGVVAHKLKYDDTISEALRVLGDTGLYTNIVTSQDTRRNYLADKR